MPRPATYSLWASRPVTLLLAVPVGGALWAAFPDQGWWPLGIVAVTLLHLALGRDGAGWNFLVGLVAGLVFFLPHLWWALDATAAVPWVAVSLLAALGPAVFGTVWTWARRLPWVRDREWAQVLAFATVWTAVEQWRSEVPFGGFPWGRLAWSVAGAPTGRAAWLGGTPLVSFVLAAAGVLLAVAVRHAAGAVRGRSGRRRHLGAAAVAVVVGGVGVLGPVWLPLPTAGDERPVADPPVTDVVDVPDRSVFADAGTGAQQSGVLRVGIVQGNVSEPGLGSFANRAEVLNNHLDGTRDVADDVAARAARGEPDPGVDVVLWPENGSDLDPQVAHDVARALDAATERVGAPILVGAQEYPETGGRYNVLLLWRDGQGVISRYAKQHPAPFGEYIPMRSFARLFSDQVDRVSTDMLAADNPPLIDLPSARLGRTVRLGTAICFEVAYDEILRDAVRRGAEVLVVPTNNASFGVTPQSTQQLQMTRLQAIASGRAAVQISTVGVSGVIAPDGTLVARTGLFTADRISAELPLRTTWTPAVAAGYWPGWVVSASGGLLALAGLAVGMHRRRLERAA
ncbi:apolipoprotein N-acyltransferase [Xylanimonas allomyrinae]|uniref:Apolipoprotein N-acyltransferase n=1 Tax=Xylanimonas allomyrinae TaxID=2509459 RepID=A0A4P6EQS9_9MICO|nr:apolipoprotein N-acyltransferase [Xylanimonas allomyrinae]QAY62667.1 apolipoprotein N-acyltransferase [Xylanimonas allomyrinae]